MYAVKESASSEHPKLLAYVSVKQFRDSHPTHPGWPGRQCCSAPPLLVTTGQPLQKGQLLSHVRNDWHPQNLCFFLEKVITAFDLPDPPSFWNSPSRFYGKYALSYVNLQTNLLWNFRIRNYFFRELQDISKSLCQCQGVFHGLELEFWGLIVLNLQILWMG